MIYLIIAGRKTSVTDSRFGRQFSPRVTIVFYDLITKKTFATGVASLGSGIGK